ncbi:unnamed protein product [Ambrosiozyma monospora]|uniref:Unnamed protein product n=1 Tax=Ambrosiozyma monospora TaxID=43982 RepID=A0ACB5SRN1_AMBMO|nr:unnamed protein product [Ambrosiozyma monospora]
MTPDEAMVYSHISASGREGIWTKTIKAKTNLHQHVVSKCHKSLENQSYVKVIKSAKFPQRKIYMLYNLTPSIEVTGGPWFTDSELDTDFISALLIVIWKFVAKKSYPTLKHRAGKQISYALANELDLPDAKEIAENISVHRVSQVELNLSDVQSLCDVLCYEERFEKMKNGCYKATWQSILETSHSGLINGGDDDGAGGDELDDDVLNINDCYRVLQTTGTGAAEKEDDGIERVYLDANVSQ